MTEDKIAAEAKPQDTQDKQDLAALDQSPDQAPRFKVSKEGDVVNFALDPLGEDSFSRLMAALGTKDRDFLQGLLYQVGRASLNAEQSEEHAINFMLSVVKGIEPRDQLETMLAAQMAATFNAAMSFASRLNYADGAQLFIKLTQAFTAQMEALKRYRGGGERPATVQNVALIEANQAIVGNVTHSVGKPVPNEAAAARPLLADAKAIPMPSLQKDKERVPVSRVAQQSRRRDAK